MTDAPTPAALRAWRLFLEVHAAVLDRLGRELEADRQLPLTWYDVLLHLSEAPERRLRMHELARAVLISRSGLTRVVDRMEARALVRRESHPSDGRGTVCVLTPEGRTTLRRAAPIHLRGVSRHFTSRLSDTEIGALSDVLQRIASAAAENG